MNTRKLEIIRIETGEIVATRTLTDIEVGSAWSMRPVKKAAFIEELAVVLTQRSEYTVGSYDDLYLMISDSDGPMYKSGFYGADQTCELISDTAHPLEATEDMQDDSGKVMRALGLAGADALGLASAVVSAIIDLHGKDLILPSPGSPGLFFEYPMLAALAQSCALSQSVKDELVSRLSKLDGYDDRLPPTMQKPSVGKQVANTKAILSQDRSLINDAYACSLLYPKGSASLEQLRIDRDAH